MNIPEARRYAIWAQQCVDNTLENIPEGAGATQEERDAIALVRMWMNDLRFGMGRIVAHLAPTDEPRVEDADLEEEAPYLRADSHLLDDILREVEAGVQDAQEARG